MERWLKCNRCYRAVKNSTKEFYVTQCQHVFCNVCVVEARKQCHKCKATGLQTISLKNTPPQISHYFSPLSQLVDRTLEAARFQKSQFEIFIHRSREVDEKYEKLKKTKIQALEYKKKLQATLNKLTEDLQKFRVIDMRGAAWLAQSTLDPGELKKEEDKRGAHHSVAGNSNITRLSNNPMKDQRVSRKVPEINYQYAQQKIRVSNDQEHHIKRTLVHNETSARSRSNARVVSQRPIIPEASRMSMASISADSRSLIRHRDSQNLTQRSVYQNQTHTHMMNIRSNPQFSESHYQPRSILSGAHSHLERTPQEEIRRAAINRRIPQSLETISPQSSSDCNTPNVTGRSSNYNCWNIPSR